MTFAPKTHSDIDPPNPWHIAVLIPARNEEDLLPRCLHSILAARARLPITVTCDIIVAVDSSTDRTREIARAILNPGFGDTGFGDTAFGDTGFGAVLSTDAGVVGQTRALAASLALSRHTGPTHLCWLANTDADCAVPASWLVDHLASAQSGIEAIAGTVDVDHFAEHGPEVRQRFLDSYLVHSDGSHPHVHGANIGVRADAYLRAGGWAHLHTAEDHDLWNRLHTSGSRRASISRLRVITSGRRIGRAPAGFAGALAAHNESRLNEAVA